MMIFLLSQGDEVILACRTKEYAVSKAVSMIQAHMRADEIPVYHRLDFAPFISLREAIRCDDYEKALALWNGLVHSEKEFSVQAIALEDS